MNHKIAYLTSKNPFDKKESSGVYYYQSQALKKYCGEVFFLGPVRNVFINMIIKSINIINRTTKKKYKHSHSIVISKIYGKIFTRKLRHKNYDFIYSDKSSCEIAYLKTNIPIIYSTDATFNLLHNYYPDFSNLYKISEKEGNIIEQKAINNASLIVCTSEWAASSVKKDYNCTPEKIYVLPRGANIDMKVTKQTITRKRKTETCRLLFIGRECERKGYDMAYQTMAFIRSKGISVKMVVIGCNPPNELLDNDVEVIPFINKNTKKGMIEFDRVMLNSDFFLLPTKAECVAIAFNEASAYGLPVITTDTGGVTEVVKNGINGFAFKPNSLPKDLGEKIIEIFSSDEKYYSLVLSSREYYEDRLNWDKWGEQMAIILRKFSSPKNTNGHNQNIFKE